MRTLLLSLSRRAVVVGLLLAAMPALAQLTPAELIDVAGRQRMLSQRIVKAYAQMAQEVQYDVSEDQLHTAVELFEDQLAAIKHDAPAGKIQDSLRDVEKLWKPFRALATTKVSKDGAKKLMESSERLLRACQQVVLQLEDGSGLPQAHLVNISGRQRMLSQRIAKAYMLLSWGFKNAELREQLDQSRYEFEGALSELRKAKINSPEISRALDEVERQWTVFRGSFQLREAGTYVPLHVAMSSEKILQLFNDITRMYAIALKDGPKSERGYSYGLNDTVVQKRKA